MFVSVIFFAQKKNVDNSIKINTKFEIELFNTDSINFDFKISNKEVFNEYIKGTDTNNLFDSIVPESKIQGVFAYGEFGGRKSVLLILKSGLDNVIDYDLKIKLPNKRRFLKTSTIELNKGVKSIEYWPYQIEKIDFVKFKIIPKNELQSFEIDFKVDSTCIKNSNINKEYGEKQFLYHLKSIVSNFDNDSLFELRRMIDYEVSNSFEDVSLGHFWTLGEGIYQNTNNFKFGNPLTYRRVECPYFDGKVNYFYTKNDELIKVISYNWNEFKISNWPTENDIDRAQLSDAFKNKYDFIVKEVNKLLGNPKQSEKEESGRRKTKWENTNGIKAYLFNFSNYNEIRLYIYKE